MLEISNHADLGFPARAVVNAVMATGVPTQAAIAGMAGGACLATLGIARTPHSMFTIEQRQTVIRALRAAAQLLEEAV